MAAWKASSDFDVFAHCGASLRAGPQQPWSTCIRETLRRCFLGLTVLKGAGLWGLSGLSGHLVPAICLRGWHAVAGLLSSCLSLEICLQL